MSLPTFIPFFGAFVTIRHARARAVAERAHLARRPVRRRPRRGRRSGRSASTRDSTLLVVLANIGFLLNAFNLLPIGFLDGGTISRSISRSRRGWIRYENGVPVEAFPPDREHANARSRCCTSLLAAALVARPARHPAQRDALDDAGPRAPPDAPQRSSISAAHSKAIAEEFFSGFEACREDRPPGGLVLRLGARAGRVAAVRARARDGAPLRARRAGRSSRAAGRA